MKPLLSVVVPVGDGTASLEQLAERVDEACHGAGVRCELLLVAWGSGRATARATADLPLSKSRGVVRAMRLGGVRAGGTAVGAGLRRAAGDLVLLLDPGATIEAGELRLALGAIGGGEELVVARRGRRARGALGRLATLLPGSPAEAPGAAGFVLLAQHAARVLPLYGNLHVFLPAAARHWGLRVAEVDLPAAVTRPARAARRRFADLLAAFFLLRFARLPLRFFGPLGTLLLLAGFAIDGALVYQKLVHGQGLSDRPLLLLGTLLMVLGVQALSLGLVAELIVFIHARKLRDYRVAEEWSGEAARGAEPEPRDERRERRRLHAVED